MTIQMVENVRKIALLTSVLFMLFSCSIEKRLYSSGYNIDWFNHKNAINSNTANNKQKTIILDTISELAEYENDQNKLALYSVNYTLFLDNSSYRKKNCEKQNISQKQNSIQTKNISIHQDLKRNIKSSTFQERNSQYSDSDSFSRKWGDVTALIITLLLLIGIIIFLHWLYVHYSRVFWLIIGALGVLLVIGSIINIVIEIKDKKKRKKNSP